MFLLYYLAALAANEVNTLTIIIYYYYSAQPIINIISWYLWCGIQMD